jgi:hypothetical protein
MFRPVARILRRCISLDAERDRRRKRDNQCDCSANHVQSSDGG